ncbi:TPA: phospholipid-binding protein MlaC [Haemophilus influenzae]|uniref:phospholipid-binding protein MlaC n=1 Tax=Haemophilus influenzae TaxID=727 RepID=UPI0001A3F323|nr:phospholipid-binding protein MlaC [Haemophilus influenzae]AVI96253.1 mlaC [Haemophilus influenzae]AVI98025.1 mlaC [Haemophilus influenzae]AVJ07044.1 mlaC [Haemophilus influenzae]AVJ08878.1 mlaC [Haemophilus influenzae]EEP46837.1 conserved ABC-type transport system protein [Haemophilus influenzae 7P49H1]
MNLTQLKKWFTILTFVLTALLVTRTAIAETSPYVLMQQASDKLFSDIQANQSKIKQDPNYLRTIVRNDLLPYVNLEYAGSKVLGSYYKSTSTEQREKFFKTFGELIEQKYAQALTNYSNQKIQIESEKELGDNNFVNIRVSIIQTNGVAPILLDFKWRKGNKSGEWKAYDMAAAGVSMLEDTIKNWVGILNKQGIDKLITKMQQSASQPIIFNQ